MQKNKRRNKSNRRGDVDNSALELAHAGRTIPPATLRRALADTNKRISGIAKEKLALYREAAKIRGKIRSSRDAQNPESLKELQAFGDRIANRAVVAPKVIRPLPSILAGQYSLRLTPTYDYAQAQSLPSNSRNTSFADRQLGTMGFNTYAERKGADAFASISLGDFFFPMFGPARLTASINPALSYAWWVISTGTVGVSLGLMYLSIYAYNIDGTFADVAGSEEKVIWFQQFGLDVNFDFGSISDNPLSAGMNVDTNHFYLIKLECLGQAFSSGSDKPGFTSNAGGILNLTLPYIDVDMRLIRVVEA